jgi:lipoate-protein ligase A
VPIPHIEFLPIAVEHDRDQLIWDEALVQLSARGELAPCLRIWQVAHPMVVMGYGNRAATEVNLEACQRLNIPVRRRSSGGGAVYLDAGCLNFSLVLPVSSHPSLASVTTTNDWIMHHQRAWLTDLIGQPVTREGDTDLAIRGLKCSGNAQRRLAHAVLFQGTLLFQADLSHLSQVLRTPSRQPAWRGERSHDAFVVNLGLDPSRVRESLLRHWCQSNHELQGISIPNDLWHTAADRLKG